MKIFNSIMNILKPNHTQKWFLIIWIPMMIVISVFMFGQVGTTRYTFDEINDPDARNTWNVNLTVDEVLSWFPFLVGISFMLYVMTGVPDSNDNGGESNRQKQ